MRVEAVSPYPPATSRSLEQWLDAEYATQAGPETATRLREIARDRATLKAMWAAFVGLGASAVLLTAALFALDRNPLVLALGDRRCDDRRSQPAEAVPRASVSLRRAASRHPQLQTALEQERLSWTPAHGAVMFGPL